MKIHYFIVRNRFYGTYFWLKAFTLPSLKIKRGIMVLLPASCWAKWVIFGLNFENIGPDWNSDSTVRKSLACSFISWFKVENLPKRNRLKGGWLGGKSYKNCFLGKPQLSRTLCGTKPLRLICLKPSAPLLIPTTAIFRARNNSKFWQFVLWTP